MPLNTKLRGPKFVQLFGPLLSALHELGGSARPAEVVDKVATDLGMSEDELAEPLPSGTSPRFRNLVAWARFYLAKAGHIDASRRGVWTLTDAGRAVLPLSHEQALALFKDVHRKFPKRAAEAESARPDEDASAPAEDAVTATTDYHDDVVALLQSLPPDGFERFCQRLLRESGFQEVSVTGRSGDGGIDGNGLLQVNPLVSFKVLFQCKRYRGSVTASQVRDFRGAMMGRADKGIIITTGSFTSDARREAVRDGVPAIELVDEDKLVGMLKDLELGLHPIQSYAVDAKFFDEFR